jgi:hypothetical protein
VSPVIKYAVAGTALLALAVGGLWPFLSPEAWTGVLRAALIALPLQLVLFALLLRGRRGSNSFLMVWAGGTLIRMGAVVAAAVLLMGSSSAMVLSTLLALAGFLFALLLLEPIFLKLRPFELRQES